MSRVFFRAALAAIAAFCPRASNAWVPADSPADRVSPGSHVEITFNNGSTLSGEIIESDRDLFLIRDHGRSPFRLQWKLVDRVRPLAPAQVLLDQADREIERGSAPKAIALLSRARELDPTLSIDGRIARLRDEIDAQNKQARSSELQALDEEIAALTDRRRFGQALDLIQGHLDLDPENPDLLERAVEIDFRIHRATALPARFFRSRYVDRLVKVRPDSPVLAAIDVEIADSQNGQLEWEEDRKSYLATALDRADRLFHDLEKPEDALNVIEYALALQPPEKIKLPLLRLARRVRPIAESSRAERDRRRRDRIARAAASRVNPGGGYGTYSGASALRSLPLGTFGDGQLFRRGYFDSFYGGGFGSFNQGINIETFISPFGTYLGVN